MNLEKKKSYQLRKNTSEEENTFKKFCLETHLK